MTTLQPPKEDHRTNSSTNSMTRNTPVKQMKESYLRVHNQKIPYSIDSYHPEMNVPIDHERYVPYSSSSSLSLTMYHSSQLNDGDHHPLPPMNGQYEGLLPITSNLNNQTHHYLPVNYQYSSQIEPPGLQRSVKRNPSTIAATRNNPQHQSRSLEATLAAVDSNSKDSKRLNTISVNQSNKQNISSTEKRAGNHQISVNSREGNKNNYQNLIEENFATFHPSNSNSSVGRSEDFSSSAPEVAPNYYYLRNEEINKRYLPLNQNYNLSNLELPKQLPLPIPEFSPSMMPFPYYAFPYIDYRTLSDSFHKDSHHAPAYPIYSAMPPTSVVGQVTEPPSVPMAILTPPAAVICAPTPPEAPQFGPGPPIITGEKLKGPRGCNLFVFHLPNEITNWDLYLLFRRHGTILSVHIMVNKVTGLSKGYGFVSFAFPEDAKNALEAMDGFRLGKKRLKVQLKRLQDDSTDEFPWEDSNSETNLPMEMNSAQTSTSTTSQASPNKHLAELTAVPTQVKLQDATKKLSEMNLMAIGGKNSSTRVKAREPPARDSKV